MSQSVVSLPVSVEQIAAAIRQMPPAERKRLLDLVPELRQFARRTLDEARTSAASVRADVQQALAGQALSSTDPFLGDLTLDQYLALPDEERARLWETPVDATWIEAEERDVRSDTLSAR